MLDEDDDDDGCRLIFIIDCTENEMKLEVCALIDLKLFLRSWMFGHLREKLNCLHSSLNYVTVLASCSKYYLVQYCLELLLLFSRDFSCMNKF